NLVTHLVDILIAHKSGNRVFGNYECDFGGCASGNHGRDNSTFAVSMQPDASWIDIESGSQKINSRQNIVSKVVIGRRSPVTRGKPGTSFVVDERRNVRTGKLIGDKTVGAPATLATTSLKYHYGLVSPRRTRHAQRT